MAEYIEKDALYRKVAELEMLARDRYLDTPTSSPVYPRYMAQLGDRTQLKFLIADFPAADVVEVKRGRWVEKKDGFWKKNILICSNCESRNALCYEFNFCPNCGAEMDLEG